MIAHPGLRLVEFAGAAAGVPVILLRSVNLLRPERNKEVVDDDELIAAMAAAAIPRCASCSRGARWLVAMNQFTGQRRLLFACAFAGAGAGFGRPVQQVVQAALLRGAVPPQR